VKIAVIGNTKQTLKGIVRLIKEKYRVAYVFGLPPDKFVAKVNAVSLEKICNENDIIYDTTNNWDNVVNLDTDLIICLGDSRIIPSKVLNKHKVIGNHGAILPSVQGGASLVWGRMLNLGMWGVSIMELEEVVDSGKILVTKEFKYSARSTMEQFVNKADDVTIEALFEYLNGDYTPKDNSPWDMRIAKNSDSEVVINIAKDMLKAKKNIYLPPRNSSNSELKAHWGKSFKSCFKKANDHPYPVWLLQTLSKDRRKT
jgi:methionyl-tRNA formyltransferase